MEIDTLVLAIVQRDDADAAIDALTGAGYGVTVIASVGGFLSAPNVTLLIGLRAGELERALEVLKTSCHRRALHTPVETSIGGATAFVFRVARYVHIGADRVVEDYARAPSPPGTLQLILAVVAREQANQLIEMLTDWSYHVTMLATTGGYSHRANTTLLSAVRAERVDSIVQHIRQVCEASGTNATLLILPLEQLGHF